MPDNNETLPNNFPVAVAQAVADKLVELGIMETAPEVALVPWYDTQTERDIKVVVLPSNITTDSRVGRGIIKQVFAVQITVMKYLQDGDISYANDALKLIDDMTKGLTGEDITAEGYRLSISAVVMYGATEILWNGDYQIDGLLKQETLANADVFSSSFVVVCTRYLVK